MPKPPATISLAEFVKTTADELRRIRADTPADGDAVIELRECELEVGAVVKAEVSGGFKIWILSAEAKGSVEASTTVRLKFGALGVVQAVSALQGALPKPRRQKTK